MFYSTPEDVVRLDPPEFSVLAELLAKLVDDEPLDWDVPSTPMGPSDRGLTLARALGCRSFSASERRAAQVSLSYGLYGDRELWIQRWSFAGAEKGVIPDGPKVAMLVGPSLLDDVLSFWGATV